MDVVSLGEMAWNEAVQGWYCQWKPASDNIRMHMLCLGCGDSLKQESIFKDGRQQEKQLHPGVWFHRGGDRESRRACVVTCSKCTESVWKVILLSDIIIIEMEEH